MEDIFEWNKKKNTRKINAEVSQSSLLGLILYLLFTYDISDLEEVITATFADDTAILVVGSTMED